MVEMADPIKYVIYGILAGIRHTSVCKQFVDDGPSKRGSLQGKLLNLIMPTQPDWVRQLNIDPFAGMIVLRVCKQLANEFTIIYIKIIIIVIIIAWV